jgi:3-isopropylmalate/(R)-2-methylmalate dehydratase small subunit
VQNGLLTAAVADEEAAEIMGSLAQTPELAVTVDLDEQSILCGNRTYRFRIDPIRRMRLLNGWDDLALTENYRERIRAFKADDNIKRPWAAPREQL